MLGATTLVTLQNGTDVPLALDVNGTWIGTVAPHTTAALPFALDDLTTSIQARSANGAALVGLIGTRSMFDAAIDGSMPMAEWQDLACGRVVMSVGPFDPAVLPALGPATSPCP
jgi:hypothetical protein